MDLEKVASDNEKYKLKNNSFRFLVELLVVMLGGNEGRQLKKEFDSKPLELTCFEDLGKQNLLSIKNILEQKKAKMLGDKYHGIVECYQAESFYNNMIYIINQAVVKAELKEPYHFFATL